MQFVHQSFLPVAPARVFAFHERPDALQLLTPPWEQTQVLQPPKSLTVGTVVILRTRIGPLWITIEAEHTDYQKDVLFEDTQRRGPFRAWRHRHLFLPQAATSSTPAGTLLRDEIEYEPPLHALGRLVDPVLIRPRLTRLFTYRHQITARQVLAA